MHGNGEANGSETPLETTVLLVDDDGAWLESTATVLEQQRDAFTVRTATDLASAEEIFHAEDPDCVVCDYDLGHGTGLELLSVVREFDDRPFILITGQGDESIASRAIGQQVTDYIPKRSLGGRNDLLARRIETVVDAHRTERALARERKSKEAMLDIVTATSSRDGVAREFCEHLVRARNYACAWVATLDRAGGVLPRAVAGEADYPDAVVDPGDRPTADGDPVLAAIAAERPQLRESITGETGDWRATAADHGFRAAAAVPIVHEDTIQGALGVYRTEPGLPPGEDSLLVEYADTLAYALRSAAWKESLLAAEPVSVEVSLSDPSVPLVALANHLGSTSRLAVRTSAERADTLLYVLDVEGTDPSTFRSAVDDAPGCVEATVHAAGPPLRAEVVASLPTPESVVAAQGGRVLETAVADGRATLTVVSPSQEDVRTVTSALANAYADADVRAVRSGDPATPTSSDPLAALTDKQREAIEVAFYNGYFERPRAHDGREVAAKLGVSRQTFTQHLRAAQRKLLAELTE